MDSNTTNFVRWLLARSDVEAAVKVLSFESGPDVEKFLNYINQYWPHLTDIEAYRKVYEEAGKIEAEVVKAFDDVPKQPRFEMVAWVANNLKKCHRILDYGCSRGIWAIHLHNRFGKEWALYDIDEKSIEEARGLVYEHAKDPSVFSFHVVHDGDPDIPSTSFDCAMLLEILEHVQNPLDLLMKIEKVVCPGGIMVISVPSGPVEYTMWVDHPDRRREHLREFDFDDLVDLLGSKNSFYMQYMYYGPEKYTKMGHGHFVAAWRVDGSPFGTIDFTRKLRPRLVPFIDLPGF